MVQNSLFLIIFLNLLAGVLSLGVPVIYNNFRKLYPAPPHVVIVRLINLYVRQTVNASSLGLKVLSLFVGLTFCNSLIFIYSFSLINSLMIILAIWLIVLAGVLDLVYKVIPDFVTYPLILVGIGLGIFQYIVPMDAFLGAVVGYFLPLLVGLIFSGSLQAIGGGDIKYLSGIGAIVGLANLDIVLLTAFIVHVFIYIVKRIKYFPLAPVISAASIGVLIYNL